MKALLLTLIVYVAAVFDTALADAMRIGHAAPDMLALTAVVWLLVAAGPRALLTAGLIALVGDLVAPGHVGVGAFWMLLVGYAIYRLRTLVKLDHLPERVLVVWAAVTIWAIASGLTGRLWGDVALPSMTVVTRASATGLYTAGVSLPVLMVLGWFREPRLATQGKLAEL